jgi:cold shock CspA family protein
MNNYIILLLLNNIKIIPIIYYNRMSTNDAVTTSTGTTSADRLIGRVKWFNNKAGYGFITVTDGDKSGSDIFAHHSSIGVSNQQYKYLVQGEYVEFSLSSTQTGTHEFQSANVCGIKGGKLMCETRNENKTSRNNYKSASSEQTSDHQPDTDVKMPRQQRPPRQESDNDKKEWTLVKNSKPESEQTQTQSQSQPSRSTKPNSGRGRGRPRSTLNGV